MFGILESTAKRVVDIVIYSLMGMTYIGWWIGSLSVALVNVVATAMTDEEHSSSVFSYKVDQRDELRFKQDTRIRCGSIRK